MKIPSQNRKKGIISHFFFLHYSSGCWELSWFPAAPAVPPFSCLQQAHDACPPRHPCLSRPNLPREPATRRNLRTGLWSHLLHAGSVPGAERWAMMSFLPSWAALTALPYTGQWVRSTDRQPHRHPSKQHAQPPSAGNSVLLAPPALAQHIWEEEQLLGHVQSGNIRCKSKHRPQISLQLSGQP